ncbi:hypothetical protein ICW40_00935 [Actinotalea ferrariae]|uniref:hypothetical protein n=1 Tax=Actinotalea ferrariae TaxID=1386098 RepID=UPI001C8CB788|nr:hypothetical protein [Actinotalea ferrariae]MBX9243369.1 hypothetical protein [Actinotalea ferrariae]
MDLAAALATIEDEPRRRSLLPLLVAALVVAAVGVQSDGLSVVAILAAAWVASVVVKRQHEREVVRRGRVGDAVAAFLQVEHGLAVDGPVCVHLRGAHLAALDGAGSRRTVDVRWTALAGRDGHPPVAIAGPVEVRLATVVPVVPA